MSPPAPAAPARPETLHRPTTFRVAPPPRNNNALIIGVVAAGALMVGLIVAAHSMSREKKAPEPAPKAEAPEPTRPAPPPAPPARPNLFSLAPEPPAAGSPVPPAVAPRPAPAPVAATPPVPAAPEPAAATPLENLPVECRIVRIGLTGLEQPYVQGSVRNDRAEGLKSVTVEVHLPEAGKQTTVSIECQYLAPGARVSFLKPCYVSLADGFKPEALVVKALPLTPKQICWAVGEALVKGDDASETRTVSGSVRNPLDVYVSNIEVYADVYFSDGRSAGPTVKGKLEHGNSLPPGGRDDFSLTFTPASVGTRMQPPVARVVGTVP